MATFDLTSEEARKPSQVLASRLQVATLCVVQADFPKIKTGVKREYRSYRLRFQIREDECAVVWTARGAQLQTCVVVVSASWQEPLHSISEESWVNEGFNSFEEFRSYFRERENVGHGARGQRQGYRPLDAVQVLRFRVLEADEQEERARDLFERLYGRWA